VISPSSPARLSARLRTATPSICSIFHGSSVHRVFLLSRCLEFDLSFVPAMQYAVPRAFWSAACEMQLRHVYAVFIWHAEFNRSKPCAV
jgi:hypothetical protein